MLYACVVRLGGDLGMNMGDYIYVNVRVIGLWVCGLWCVVFVWCVWRRGTYLKRRVCVRGVVCGYEVGMVGDVGLVCGVWDVRGSVC